VKAQVQVQVQAWREAGGWIRNPAGHIIHMNATDHTRLSLVTMIIFRKQMNAHIHLDFRG
jgi:hypothetical protein